jgi:hypothetical protein
MFSYEFWQLLNTQSVANNIGLDSDEIIYLLDEHEKWHTENSVVLG